MTLSADEQLLAASKAGDKESFSRLIQPHLAAGYRLANAMLDDSGVAEDVLQESTLRAWRGVRGLASGSAVRSWFLAIVANRARTTRQRSWWSVLVLPLSSAVHRPGENEIEERMDLMHAVRGLRPEDRVVVVLRFYEDMNSTEIAEVLGITASTVRSRIRKALSRLRIELTEEYL